MKAKYVINAETLKGVSDVIRTQTEEVLIMIAADGWHIKTVDPAHVSMAKIDMPARAFEEYNVVQDPVPVGIDMQYLNSMFKGLNKTQRKKTDITLVFDTEMNKYTYSNGMATRDGDLLDTTNISDPKIPNMTLTIDYEVKAEEVMKVIKMAKEITDYLIFTAQDNHLRILAKGNDKKDQYDLPDVELRGPYKSMFSLNYLYEIFRVLHGTVRILGADDYPMRIETTNEDIEYVVLLAPRIEADENDEPTTEPEEVQEQDQDEPEPVEVQEDVQDEPEPVEVQEDVQDEPEPVEVQEDVQDEPEPVALVDVSDALEVLVDDEPTRIHEIEENPKTVKLQETGETGEVLGITATGYTVRRTTDGLITWWKKLEVQAVA